MAKKPKKAKPTVEMGSPEANGAVRDQLGQFGDDGKKKRHVLHYAYPKRGKDLASRKAMVQAMKKRGFKVSDAVVKKGLVLEHQSAVTAPKFDALTTELREWFAEHGWDYDGWECAVAL